MPFLANCMRREYRRRLRAMVIASVRCLCCTTHGTFKKKRRKGCAQKTNRDRDSHAAKLFTRRRAETERRGKGRKLNHLSLQRGKRNAQHSQPGNHHGLGRSTLKSKKIRARQSGQTITRHPLTLARGGTATRDFRVTVMGSVLTIEFENSISPEDTHPLPANALAFA